MKEVRRGVETEGPLLTTGPEMGLGMDGLQEDPPSNSRQPLCSALASYCQTLPQFEGPACLVGRGRREGSRRGRPRGPSCGFRQR